MKYRKEIIGDATLYLGDCLEVMVGMETKSIDAVVTDPVYGVGLGEVITRQSVEKNQQKYDGFSDTPEYVESVCVPAIKMCIKIAERCLVTTGNRNMWMYPQPADMGVWWNPAGTSRGKWGFNCVVTPILYYGKERRGSPGMTPSSPTGLHDRQEKPDHPCPKPLQFVKWLVNKGSVCGETVMDPFMGSGTTGVACYELGRKFIGIEISEKYFDIACKRIDMAHKQLKLF